MSKSMLAKPNVHDAHIGRILYILTRGWLKNKWTKEKLGTDKDLHEIFYQFLLEQQVPLLCKHFLWSVTS